MSGQTQANTRNSVILDMKFTKSGTTGKTNIESVSYIPIYMYKDPSKKTHKYRILDIEETISNYDSGSDKSIGVSTYSTLKTELTKIRKTMGDDWELK